MKSLHSSSLVHNRSLATTWRGSDLSKEIMEEEVLQTGEKEGGDGAQILRMCGRGRRGSNRSLVQFYPRPRFFRFADVGDYEFWLVPFIEVSRRALAILLHVLGTEG